jgi:hypothetical protein
MELNINTIENLIQTNSDIQALMNYVPSITAQEIYDYIISNKENFVFFETQTSIVSTVAFVIHRHYHFYTFQTERLYRDMPDKTCKHFSFTGICCQPKRKSFRTISIDDIKV